MIEQINIALERAGPEFLAYYQLSETNVRKESIYIN